ncbi:MAG: ATP phosphoribosyltransferase, partial [Hyphomonadaceae bacterium]
VDVQTLADLDAVCHAFRLRTGARLRVATKYMALTRAFFAAHGLHDYRVVESLGATEGAPGAGAAEIIVDITTTGATLAANHLKIVADGVILRSQAHLAASRAAHWTPQALAALAVLTESIEARARARARRALRVTCLPAAAAAVRAAAAALGCEPVEGGESLTFLCASETLARAGSALLRAGALAVSVQAPDFLFAGGGEALRRFHDSIDKKP